MLDYYITIMAIPNPELINALRATARKLSSSDNYQWGHMGSCNCGHLAQELTHLSKAEIHAFAMERYGDWSQQTKDFCPDSKLPIDLILQTMFKAGLTRSDIRHLEKLSDNKIINSLPENDRELMQNIKDDVIKYINAWVQMLELELADEIKLNMEELSLQKKLISDPY